MKCRVYLLLIFILFTQKVSAQQEVLSTQRSRMISTGITFQMWDKRTSPAVSQAAFPFKYLSPLTDNITLSISNTPAVSWWFGDYKIFGLSDTWINTSFLLFDKKMVLNVGMGVPTGKTHLDLDEYKVITEGLTKNIYRYQLPVYGQGFSFRTGFAYSFPLSERVVIGLGGQYLLNSSYVPVEYDFDFNDDSWAVKYKPGDVATANIGIDVGVTDNIKVMFDWIYSYYRNDMLEDSLLYRTGGKVSFNTGFFYRFDNKYLWLFTKYRQRGENTELGDFRLAHVDPSDRYQFEVDMVLKPVEFSQGDMLVLADIRYYGKNESLKPENVIGGGLGIIYEISRYLKWDLRMKYFVGDVGGQTVNGFHISNIFKYEF